MSKKQTVPILPLDGVNGPSPSRRDRSSSAARNDEKIKHSNADVVNIKPTTTPSKTPSKTEPVPRTTDKRTPLKAIHSMNDNTNANITPKQQHQDKPVPRSTTPVKMTTSKSSSATPSRSGGDSGKSPSKNRSFVYVPGQSKAVASRDGDDEQERSPRYPKYAYVSY